MSELDDINTFKAALGEALGKTDAHDSYMANRRLNSDGEYPPDPAIAIQEQADGIAVAVISYLQSLGDEDSGFVKIPPVVLEALVLTGGD